MNSIRSILVAGLALMSAGAAWAEDPVGKWSGLMTMGNGQQLSAVFTLSKDAEGKLTGSGESPMQAPGAMIPLTDVVSDGANLSLAIPSVGASYKGSWDAAQKAWVGTFTQNGGTTSLNLMRTP